MSTCPHTCCDGPCPGHRLDPVDCLACTLMELGAAGISDAKSVQAAVRADVLNRLEGSPRG